MNRIKEVKYGGRGGGGSVSDFFFKNPNLNFFFRGVKGVGGRGGGERRG